MSRGGDTGTLPAVAPYFSRLETTWLAEQPETLHRRLDGSLLSADLSGFTALSERLADRGKEGSERLTAMVNGCFSAIMNPAFLEGGDVLKFGGDALLIWFDGPDHQVRSTMAAARMQRAIGAARFLRAGLRMSVGVHSATFDAFLVGPREWRELIVAGREVTTTVHLESEAGAGEVMVGRELVAQLPREWCGQRWEDGSILNLDAISLPRRKPSLTASAVSLEAVPARIRADVDALDGLGGEHRLATVVFAKVEGTDDRIEADPAGMARSLDSLVRATLRDAEKYRLRFLYTDVIADGIKLICTAGAPTSTGEDEESGLRFASELSEGDPVHRLRIGVNRGRVFAGFLGSEERRTYTVMGDPVNLAARLMTKAEPGQVVASEDVVRRSRATFRLTPLAPFVVKGKQAPVSAHLLGPPTGERRGQLLSVLPLVGREAELAVLLDGIESASAGRGTVVEVTGDAGIGKTRLLEAIADDPRLVVRVATECQPYDALSPYVSARQLLRRALGISAEATPHEAGERLRTTAARIAPQLVPLLPLVAVPVGAEVDPTPESEAVAEQFWAARMHETMSTLLAAALPQTTLLVVEDVYYADDASLRLFRALAADVRERPWLMVATRRPEGPGLIADGVDGTVMKLSALGSDETARLTELANGGTGLHPLDQEALVQRAGGNPLFLLQLVSSKQAGTSTEELPESIERVVASRIDRLGPSERALLRQAAVLGRVFDPALIDAIRATEAAEPVTSEVWDSLDDLVEPAGAQGWRFRHALFRDVAYEGLPFARRRRMHRAVGELLESAVVGEPDVALLSEHFWLAGDSQRTWRYSVAAGDKAWAASAMTEAARAYERALKVRRSARPPEARVSAVAESLADVFVREARYDDALSCLDLAARTSGPQPGTRARLLRKRGELHERVGRYATALACFARGRRELHGERSGEAAWLDIATAGVKYRQGRHGDMAHWAHTAIEAARTGDQELAEGHAKALLVLASVYGAASDPERLGEEALAIFERHDDALRAAKVVNNLGMHAYYTGAWGVAQKRWRTCAEYFAKAGDVDGTAIAHNNVGEVLSDQGRLDEAEAALGKGHQIWSSAHYPLGTALGLSNLGRLAARQGRVEDALELTQRAADMFLGLGAPAYALEALARHAEANLLAGHAEEAFRDATETLASEHQATAHDSTIVLLERCLAWSLLQLGNAEAALQHARRAVARAESSNNPYELALSIQAESAAARTLGLDAESAPDRADSILRGLGVTFVPEVPLTRL